MKTSQFGKRLLQAGFKTTTLPGIATRYSRGVGEQSQHVVRDNVRGGSWRLYLAVGLIPPHWPIYFDGDESTAGWTAAESPWFDYFTDLDPNDPADAQFDNNEQALLKCCNWLFDTGLQWLSNPAACSPDDWRIRHNILTKHPA